MYFLSEKGKLPVVSGIVPARFVYSLIRHAEIGYYETFYGYTLSQTVKGIGIDLIYHQWEISEPVKLHPYTLQPVVCLYYALEGDIPCVLQGFGDVLLKEGEYYLFYVPGMQNNDAYFQPGRYSGLQLNISSGYLENLIAEYPHFGPLVRNASAKLPEGIRAGVSTIRKPIRATLDLIINCRGKMSKTRQKLLLSSCMQQLFIHYLEDAELQAREDQPAVSELSRFSELKQFIQENLHENLSLLAVAKTFGISESSLVRQFHLLFGQPFHQYIIQQRMDLAMSLILDTDKTIGEIAVMAGYDSISTFSRAFTKFFLRTPSQTRREGYR